MKAYFHLCLISPREQPLQRMQRVENVDQKPFVVLWNMFGGNRNKTFSAEYVTFVALTEGNDTR